NRAQVVFRDGFVEKRARRFAAHDCFDHIHRPSLRNLAKPGTGTDLRQTLSVFGACPDPAALFRSELREIFETDVVPFAEGNSVVTKNRVRRRHVEIEIRYGDALEITISRNRFSTHP